jgi:hypothetical protein
MVVFFYSWQPTVPDLSLKPETTQPRVAKK